MHLEEGNHSGAERFILKQWVFSSQFLLQRSVFNKDVQKIESTINGWRYQSGNVTVGNKVGTVTVRILVSPNESK